MYSAVSIALIFINIFNGGYAISGGKTPEPGKFTYMAYMRIVRGNRTDFCTGAILDEYHILTAAHCVRSLKPWEVFVLAGKESVSLPDAGYIVKEIHVHPHHRRLRQDIPLMERCLVTLMPCWIDEQSRYYPKNDIAILKLCGKLTFGNAVTKVELPDSDVLPYCININHAGWSEASRFRAANLRTTEVAIISNYQCHMWHTREQFCAVNLHNSFALGGGDSGSPLVYEEVVYGVLLGGIPNTTDPVIFTKKYVSEGSTVRDCVENCVEKEVWSTRTYCCQNDGCNKAGPSLHDATITTLWMTSIALGIVVAGRLGG